MKRSYRLLINLLLLVSLATCGKKHRQDSEIINQGIDTLYKLKVIGSNNDGWGYEIHKQHKLFIYQPTIPAVGENKKFISYDEASKVGGLVLKKLSARDGLPTISIEELDSLKISY